LPYRFNLLGTVSVPSTHVLSKGIEDEALVLKLSKANQNASARLGEDILDLAMATLSLDTGWQLANESLTLTVEGTVLDHSCGLFSQELPDALGKCSRDSGERILWSGAGGWREDLICLTDDGSIGATHGSFGIEFRHVC
jgi:hypothetical protein